jgi:hypothetical protein
MAIIKGKSDGGSGGKRGHSNMDHWMHTDEIKAAAKKARRLESKAVIAAEQAELEQAEAIPSFDDAVRQLQDFMRGEGWPDAIVWRNEDDILRLPGPTVVVRARSEAASHAWARQYYDEGVRAQVGICFSAECVVDGRTCATVFWTRDERTAEERMMPKIGLKLAYSTPRLEGRSRGAILWRLTKRALARFHGDLAS